MESAYTAVKRADADELCDTVPIVEADDEMLAAMWMKSCAQLLAFLRTHLRRSDGFLFSAQYDVDAFHADLIPTPNLFPSRKNHPSTLSLPLGEGRGEVFGEGWGEVFKTSMTAFLTKDILAGWMSMALPEREPACRAEAEQILLSLEQVITSYRHPLRVRKRMEIL